MRAIAGIWSKLAMRICHGQIWRLVVIGLLIVGFVAFVGFVACLTWPARGSRDLTVPRPFSLALWARSPDGALQDVLTYRFDMHKDLIKNGRLIGMTRSQLVAKLGEPDVELEKPNLSGADPLRIMTYAMRREYETVSGVHPEFVPFRVVLAKGHVSHITVGDVTVLGP